MTRQSPHRKVHLSAALERCEKDRELRALLAEVYFLALMDGMHAQVTGESWWNPFDGSAPLFDDPTL